MRVNIVLVPERNLAIKYHITIHIGGAINFKVNVSLTISAN